MLPINVCSYFLKWETIRHDVKKYHWQKSRAFLRGDAAKKRRYAREGIPRNKYYFFPILLT